ncbi:MAG: hypothetical protein R3B09_27105 [Nannocystaceae bacterium]
MRRRSTTAPDEVPERRRGARWARRSVLTLLVVVLLTPLLWLLTINLSLWTGLISAVVSGERPRSTVRLEYGWAWCVWPTVVHVEDLRLEIDGVRWQLAVEVPKGTLDMELHELLHRRFDAGSIRGEEVSLTYVVKRPFGADPEEYADYPRIDGFPPPALDESPRPIPPEDEAWQIDLREVQADLIHLRVNSLDGELRGRLQGAIEVTVGHRFAIPKMVLEVEEGTVRRGDAVVLDEVKGRLDVALAAYDPEAIQGRAALRQLSGDVELDVHTPGLGWIADLGVHLPVSIGGSEATVGAAVHVDEGVLRAGSEVHLQTHRVSIRRRVGEGSIVLSGAARVDVKVPEGGHGPRIGARMRGLRAHDAGSDDNWLRADSLEVKAGLDSPDLVDGLKRVTTWNAALPEFTADLGASSRLGEAGIRSGTLAGHASIEPGEEAKELVLDFAVDVDDLALRRGDLAIHGGGYVRSKGKIHRGDKSLELGPIRASLKGLRVDTERGHTTGSWVEVERAKVNYHWEKKRLRVDLRGKLAELRSLLAHLRPGEDLFERVPGLSIARDAVDFDLTLRRSPGSTRIDVDALKGGPFDLVASIGKAGEELRGAIYFRRAKVGLLTAGGGSRTVKVAVQPEWFEEKTAWVRGVAGD